MKITKVTVQRGKKVILDEKEEETFDVQMEALVEEQDDPQEMIHALRTILDKHLETWEYELTGKNFLDKQTEKVVIKTASDLIAKEVNSDFTNKEQRVTVVNKDMEEENVGLLICPKCNEEMKKKEGKDYYLCSKHWGYPDMIKSGKVMEKRF